MIKKTLKSEEKETFSNWMKRRSLILITVLQEVTTGSKVIVGAVHATWDILQLPALQMLEVSSKRGYRCFGWSSAFAPMMGALLV